jgi:hypothetical protein
MKIELNEEETEICIRLCKRAQILAKGGVFRIDELPPDIYDSTIEKLDVLINKLSDKKCDF